MIYGVYGVYNVDVLSMGQECRSLEHEPAQMQPHSSQRHVTCISSVAAWFVFSLFMDDGGFQSLSLFCCSFSPQYTRFGYNHDNLATIQLQLHMGNLNHCRHYAVFCF